MKNVFAGEQAGRVPVAPLVFSFAGKIRSLGPREVMSDPTALANSLIDARELFGYDAIVTWFDTTTEAEACGCAVDWSAGTPVVAGPVGEGAIAGLNPEDIEDRGRVPVAREVAARLVKQVGREVTLLGAVTGPLTLFSQLVGCGFREASGRDAAASDEKMELVGAVATRMVRLYGELGLDGVMIAEDVPGEELLGGLPGALRFYDQLFGLARYFSSAAVFVSRRCPAAEFGRLVEELLPDCIAITEGAEPREAVLKCRDEEVVPAATVPVEALLAGPGRTAEEVRRCLEAGAGGAFLLTTSWEVPAEAPMESVHELVSARGR